MTCNLLELKKLSADYFADSYSHCLVAEDDMLKWPEPEVSCSGEIWDSYLQLFGESSKRVICSHHFYGGEVFSIGGEGGAYAAWYESALENTKEKSIAFVKSIFGSEGQLMPLIKMSTEELEYIESIDVRKWKGKNVVITQPFVSGRIDYSNRTIRVDESIYGDVYAYKSNSPIEGSVFVIILLTNTINALNGVSRRFEVSREYDWCNAFGDIY